VTVHAARKWLLGEAIPTQARLQVLANWLGLSAAWLRFGDAGNNLNSAFTTDFSGLDVQLVNDFGLLSESHQRIVHMLIKTMLEEENREAGFTHAPRVRKQS